jgi:CBS domain-containing protein
MIATTELRSLDLSAASGLVGVGDFLYVVADDELQLGVLQAPGDGPMQRIRLFPGELPRDPVKRKHRKPDLETLVRLAPFGAYTAGALLALGSGSKDGRCQGALLALDERGRVVAAPRVIDLAGAYGLLEREIGALNIEGAVATPSELVLFQRGGRKRRNAVVRYPLAHVREALSGSGSFDAAPALVEEVDLGTCGGIPLGFTDAALLPDGALVFSATAEDTADAVADGACAGSALGLFGADGRLRWLEAVEGDAKIEGIDARREGHEIRVLLVTDADDRALPARLLSARVPGTGA